MTVSEDNTTDTEVDTDTTTDEQSDEYDIIRILVGSGHHAKKLENGISLAIRFSGIPDTKGVHVEVVHVLDLRCARFGKSLFGMKSYVLDAAIERNNKKDRSEHDWNDKKGRAVI